MNIEEQNDELPTESAIDGNTMLAAGWIPVTERMPPDVTPVLVFGWCCDICHNIRIAEYEVDGWWESYHGEDLTFEPEYWMPLPFPPACG
jgi:hypothetical protein